MTSLPPRPVTTQIPARLDRLPWSRFHTLVVVALGVTWILDGLEVTLAGALSGALKASPTLSFTNAEVGLAASAYLLGAVAGAVVFGWLTDIFGRKRLFFITLGLYLCATLATAASWSFWSFAAFRILTGAGIGGEYTAINSTIQELIPARVRGWTDLIINGSFWVGAAIGAGASIILLDQQYFAADVGWRLAFFFGGALGIVILFMRMWIPESPRWLISRGRVNEAEKIVDEIERKVFGEQPLSAARLATLKVEPRPFTPLKEVLAALFQTHRDRTFVGLSLMAAQAFFYNAIFFTYGLVLTDFYRIPSDHVGWYILPFALGNFLGPVLLGRLFDTLGRRPMIVFTYVMSALTLTATGYLFAQDLVSVTTLTICWMVVFFFASAAASAAYLTVSETFPVEIRALASFFLCDRHRDRRRIRAVDFWASDRYRPPQQRLRRIYRRGHSDACGCRHCRYLGRCCGRQAARVCRATAYGAELRRGSPQPDMWRTRGLLQVPRHPLERSPHVAEVEA